MYERIERLREELGRARQRKVEAERRVKRCEANLKEAENQQILADVGALKLTPEQVSEFLKLAASGQLSALGTGYIPGKELTADTADTSSLEDIEYDESEGIDDEEV